MNLSTEEMVEKICFESMQQFSPGLLKSIRTLVAVGCSSDQIVAVCAKKSGQTPERLAFIGGTADYLIKKSPKRAMLN